MSLSSGFSRTKLRGAHLVFGAISFVAVYSPALEAGTSRIILRAVVFPGLAISGIALWKVSVIRRWLAARRTRTLVP